MATAIVLVKPEVQRKRNQVPSDKLVFAIFLINSIYFCPTTTRVFCSSPAETGLKPSVGTRASAIQSSGGAHLIRAVNRYEFRMRLGNTAFDNTSV